MQNHAKYIMMLCVAILVVILGFIFTVYKSDKTGFVRTFRLIPLVITTEKELEFNDLFFFGESGRNIDLKSYKNIGFYISYNFDQNEIRYNKSVLPVNFCIDGVFGDRSDAGDNIMITNLKSQIALINQERESILYETSSIIFDQSVAVSPQSIIVRSPRLIEGTKQRELLKIRLTDSARVVGRYILPQQANSTFSTDGWLRLNKNASLLFYMFYYQGNIVCLDTNLNVVCQISTIDNIRQVKIKTIERDYSLPDGKTLKRTTNLSANSMVNSFFSIDSNKLYVLSMIPADNESKSFFSNEQVVDVYDSGTGKYIYSFYLPKYKGYKVRDFIMRRNHIVALYDRYVVTFSY